MELVATVLNTAAVYFGYYPYTKNSNLYSSLDFHLPISHDWHFTDTCSSLYS